MRLYRVPCGPSVGRTTAWVSELSFAPDGRRLAVIEGQNFMASSYDHYPVVRWLDLHSGEVCRERQLGWAHAVALSADHVHFVTAMDSPERRSAFPREARIQLFDVASEKPGRVLGEILGYLPRTAAFLPDGRQVVVALDNWNELRRVVGEPEALIVGLDVTPGEMVAQIALECRALQVAFSPDGRWFAASGHGQEVRVCDWPSGRVAATYRSAGRPKVRFAPDRPVLAAAAGKTVILWDITRTSPQPGGYHGPRLATLQRQHRGLVTDLAFSPTGCQLLTGSQDGTVCVWDLAARRCLRSFAWEIGPLTAVAWSPDGMTCAAANAAGQVVVWDAGE